MKKASKTHHPRHRFETLYKADSREAHGKVGGGGRHIGGGTRHHYHRPERYGSGGKDDRKNDKPPRTVYTADRTMRVPKTQERGGHGEQREGGGRDQEGRTGQHHSFRAGHNGPKNHKPPPITPGLFGAPLLGRRPGPGGHGAQTADGGRAEMSRSE